jgi:hypothetical protein
VIQALSFILLIVALYQTVKWLIVGMTLTYIIGFAISTGPVPYVYIAETCCDKGVTIGVFNIWLGTIIVSFITPFLIRGLDIEGMFIFYSSISVAGSFAFIAMIKETKGLTDNQCQELYSKEKFLTGTSGSKV